MSLVPWRRRLDRIDEIVVPEQTAVDPHYQRELPVYVSMCVRHALQEALYLREELPREAVIAATLADYLGEMNDGGHGWWVINTCWCAEHRSDVREGLALLGQHEAAKIFADLEAFEVLEPERFALAWRDPFFGELDRRFGRVGMSVENALIAWIKTHSWLRLMPDEEFARTRAWQTPNHRLREERLEERKRANAPELRRGLLRLQASLRAHKATGWKRVLWRLRAWWYRSD